MRSRLPRLTGAAACRRLSGRRPHGAMRCVLNPGTSPACRARGPAPLLVKQGHRDTQPAGRHRARHRQQPWLGALLCGWRGRRPLGRLLGAGRAAVSGASGGALARPAVGHEAGAHGAQGPATRRQRCGAVGTGLTPAPRRSDCPGGEVCRGLQPQQACSQGRPAMAQRTV